MIEEQRIPIGEDVRPDDAGRHFSVLYQVGKQVLSARSLDELNELALTLVFDAINAERGVLLLRDEQSGEFVPHARRSRDGTLPGPVSRGIIDEVLAGPLGILTADALHDPRFQARDSVRMSNVRSALCAPLCIDGDVLGLIYLDSRIDAYAFTRNDLGLLNAIANMIAIRSNQEALRSALTEERIVRSNLERYHPADVVDAILESRHLPQIGLEDREVTVMFTDLSGFTAMAEAATPPKVAELLNEYYAVATRAIFAHGGTVNEYLGDGVLAVFGAPLPHSKHAEKAVAAAIDLLHGVMRSPTIGEKALDLHVRIGINSGRVVAGSVGPSQQLKYAVIGDPVNVAARLERIGELDTITVGEDTFALLPKSLQCEDLGVQQLRGRKHPVRAYCIRP